MTDSNSTDDTDDSTARQTYVPGTTDSTYRRVNTADAGLRYAVQLPFEREVDAADQDAIAGVLETATIDRRGRPDYPIDPEAVTVDADGAVVTVTLALDEDHGPADIRRALYQAVGKWHTHHGPLEETTRAGGESTIGTLPSPALRLDADPAAVTDGCLYYVLALPERQLTADEAARLEAVAADTRMCHDATVTPEFMLLVVGDTRQMIRQRAVGRVRESITHPRLDDVRERSFWRDREVGTIDTLDETTREALRDRAARQSPHVVDDSDAADGEVSEA